MKSLEFPENVRRVLHVGDVHAVKEELGDCENLINLVIDTALQNSVKLILFEGDQYHTHAIMHVEVMAFWKKAFKTLKGHGLTPMCIVGNHDMPGVDGSVAHAMLAHSEECFIVDSPVVLGGNVLLLPYMSDHQKMVDTCAQYAHCPTLVCHQTFAGSTYENGFYASDGIDPELLPQTTIISGHIHTPQSFGKVFYTGAPRWRTLSDANVDRAIWVVTYKEDGKVENKKPFDTGSVCKQIKFAVDTPESPVELPLDSRHAWRVDIKGPPEWVERRKLELSSSGARVRTFSDSGPSSAIRESEGIEKAFRKFLGAYRAKHGTSLDRLSKMAEDRLGF